MIFSRSLQFERNHRVNMSGVGVSARASANESIGWDAKLIEAVVVERNGTAAVETHWRANQVITGNTYVPTFPYASGASQWACLGV
jgi:hypothetical protein